MAEGAPKRPPIPALTPTEWVLLLLARRGEDKLGQVFNPHFNSACFFLISLAVLFFNTLSAVLPLLVGALFISDFVALGAWLCVAFAPTLLLFGHVRNGWRVMTVKELGRLQNLICVCGVTAGLLYSVLPQLVVPILAQMSFTFWLWLLLEAHTTCVRHQQEMRKKE